jgi:hypothetical protein
MKSKWFLPTLLKHKTAFQREMLLFLQTPREYIYIFTYPTDKTVKIEDYNPHITQVGIKLIKKIQKELPNLKIRFIGSAALRIPGQNDIDLFVESPSKDLGKYSRPLFSILGKPTKKRRKFIEWHVKHDGCTVELVVADPLSNIFKNSVTTFQLLKDNKKLLREYEHLKFDSDGSSVREYNKRKLVFFNKILM